MKENKVGPKCPNGKLQADISRVLIFRDKPSLIEDLEFWKKMVNVPPDKVWWPAPHYPKNTFVLNMTIKAPTKLPRIFRNLEEGDQCEMPGCTGTLVNRSDDDCSCHINPPCASCSSRHLVCDICYNEAHEENK